MMNSEAGKGETASFFWFNSVSFVWHNCHAQTSQTELTPVNCLKAMVAATVTCCVAVVRRSILVVRAS